MNEYSIPFNNNPDNSAKNYSNINGLNFSTENPKQSDNTQLLNRISNIYNSSSKGTYRRAIKPQNFAKTARISSNFVSSNSSMSEFEPRQWAQDQSFEFGYKINQKHLEVSHKKPIKVSNPYEFSNKSALRIIESPISKLKYEKFNTNK